MAKADRLTIAGGTAGMMLMERAGAAVADAVAARHPVGSEVAVLAGPGNNGGDGFVAARLLAQRGFNVRLMLAGEVSHLKGDAASAAAKWERPIAQPHRDGFASASVVVDALFGAGLDRPVEGQAWAMIEAMNAQPAPILAVDLPSGINGSTGAVMGVAVNAAQSVTFFSQEGGTCPFARPASLRPRQCGGYWHSSDRATGDRREDVRERACAVARPVSASRD